MKKDLKGKKFGKLTAIKEVERNKNYRYWLCKCDCGKETIVRQCNLLSSHTGSCGCIRSEMEIGKKKHGLSKTKIYRIWVNMKSRCLNPNDPAYGNYGKRGVFVCSEWFKFERFYEDMINGYKEGLELDRIDNNKGYCKENCRWATRIENVNNRRCTKFEKYNGSILARAEIARKYNIKYATLKSRLESGWSLEKSLLTPVKHLI